jgi:hypothetical protein
MLVNNAEPEEIEPFAQQQGFAGTVFSSRP